MSDISVDIGQLVFEGVDPAEAHRIGEALAPAVRAMLEAGDLAPAPPSDTNGRIAWEVCRQIREGGAR
jgi:hypothetical protein